MYRWERQGGEGERVDSLLRWVTVVTWWGITKPLNWWTWVISVSIRKQCVFTESQHLYVLSWTSVCWRSLVSLITSLIPFPGLISLHPLATLDILFSFSSVCCVCAKAVHAVLLSLQTHQSSQDDFLLPTVTQQLGCVICKHAYVPSGDLHFCISLSLSLCLSYFHFTPPSDTPKVLLLLLLLLLLLCMCVFFCLISDAEQSTTGDLRLVYTHTHTHTHTHTLTHILRIYLCPHKTQTHTSTTHTIAHAHTPACLLASIFPRICKSSVINRMFCCDWLPAHFVLQTSLLKTAPQ